MAGSDHHPRQPQVIGLEIDLLGATQPDVDDFAAGTAQAGRQRVLQRGAGQADVVAQHHRARSELCIQGRADPACQVFVQFFRHAAADVIGLEGGQGHRSDPM